MATTTAKNYRKEITKSVGNIHDELINISDELVEGSLATARKWQTLWSKAIKNSEPLVSKQVDIMYYTLNNLKGQLKVGTQRVKSLINDELVIDTRIPTVKKMVTKKKVVAKKVSTKKVVAKKAAVKKVKSTIKVAKKNVAKSIDNLKLVTGIGPKLEAILKANGIKTFSDLSKAKITTLRTIIEKAGSRYKMQDPSTWASQAKALKK